MDAISDTVLQNNLAQMMTKVCEDHAPLTITRQNAEPVVMLSLEDFNTRFGALISR